MFLLIIKSDLNGDSDIGDPFIKFISVYAGVSTWFGNVLMGISEW